MLLAARLLVARRVNPLEITWVAGSSLLWAHALLSVEAAPCQFQPCWADATHKLQLPRAHLATLAIRLPNPTMAPVQPPLLPRARVTPLQQCKHRLDCTTTTVLPALNSSLSHNSPSTPLNIVARTRPTRHDHTIRAAVHMHHRDPTMPPMFLDTVRLKHIIRVVCLKMMHETLRAPACHSHRLRRRPCLQLDRVAIPRPSPCHDRVKSRDESLKTHTLDAKSLAARQ